MPIDYFRHHNRFYKGMNVTSRNRKNSTGVPLIPSFTHLNFGLDVIPSMSFNIPDIFLVKIICVPLYVLVMAFWFPILPVIQYVFVLYTNYEYTK